MPRSNGKRRFGRGGQKFFNNERVMEQSEVTIHVSSATDIEARRENNSLSVLDQNYVYPDGAILILHDFDEGDIIWGIRRDRNTSAEFWRPAMKSGGDRGWVALNGLNVSAFGNSFHLQNSIYAIGVAKSSTSDTNTDGSAQPFVAAATYGSRSINNVIVEQAYPGDVLIQACPNVLSSKELEDYSYGSLRLDGVKKEKLTPVLKVFDIKETKYLEVILAMKAIELNAKFPKVPYMEILDNPIDFTPEDQAAADFQHFIMATVFATFSILAGRGIAKLNLRPKASGQGFEFDPELASNGTLDVTDLLTGQTPNTSMPYADLKDENQARMRYSKLMDDDAYFDQLESEHHFMGNLLGLVDGPHLKPEDTSTVRSDILRTAFSGNTEDDLYLPLLAGVMEDEEDTYSKTVLGIDEPIAAINHYVRNMLNIGHNLHQTSVYFNKVTAGKIGGTTIGGGDFGQQLLDAMVNITSYRY